MTLLEALKALNQQGADNIKNEGTTIYWSCDGDAYCIENRGKPSFYYLPADGWVIARENIINLIVQTCDKCRYYTRNEISTRCDRDFCRKMDVFVDRTFYCGHWEKKDEM